MWSAGNFDIADVKASFVGFDSVVVAVIVMQSFGGLLVAAVLKYADSVLKCFSSSVSMMLTGAIDIIWMGTEPNFSFVVGSLVIAGATSVYSTEN